MLIRSVVAVLLLGSAAAAQAPPPFVQPSKKYVADAHPPAIVRVRLRTSFGPIVIALEMKRAPITAGNFLRYVDEHRFDGTSFYRAARNASAPSTGLVQGGIDHNMSRSWFPITHESTAKTGIRHLDATVSMARHEPGTAMGDFFVCIGPATRLDARDAYPGYAAFGHVVAGMDVVKRVLTLPTYPGGYTREMVGQTIRKPVTIIGAERVR